MEHTKGEWICDEGGEITTITPDGIGLTIATLFAVPEYEANARLIAQSPRMAEWIAKVARQDFVVFPEDKSATKEIMAYKDKDQIKVKSKEWREQNPDKIMSNQSLIQQQERGTDQRNRLIWLLCKLCDMTQVEVSTFLNLSRQRISKIVQREEQGNEPRR